MRFRSVMFAVASLLAPAAQAAGETAPPTVSLEEALKAFQNFTPGPRQSRSSITLRPREVIPSVSIYCEASQCGRAAARLCSDLGYGGSRAIPQADGSGGPAGTAGSVGVVCFDP